MSAKGFERDQSGAGALEFALVLPFFVLAVLGGLQFGWAQHSAGRTNFALERAGRALLIDPTLDDDALRAKVLAELDAVTASHVTVAIVRESGASGPIAKINGVYEQTIGLPNLAALPFRFSRTITTPIRNAT